MTHEHRQQDGDYLWEQGRAQGKNGNCNITTIKLNLKKSLFLVFPKTSILFKAEGDQS